MQTADERTTAIGLLDFLRATVVEKASGLTDDQARRATSPPSDMTVMGLAKHLTAVERWWFSIDFAGLDVTPPWPDGADVDGFAVEPDDTLAEVLAEYEREVTASNAAIAGSSFDALARQPPDEPFHLRYAVAHMIEETARHCGHLDLLRQALDGTTGQ